MSTFDAGLEFPLGGGGDLSPDPYARMMLALLPPGKVWRLLTDSVLWKLFAGCGVELARVEESALDMIGEAEPSTAVAMLPEYEFELGLASDGTTEERQARVAGRDVARQRYRPIDFKTALAPLLGQDAADIVLIERTRADAIAMDDDTEIYRFFIYRDPTLPGTYYLTSAQDLVDQIKPSHTAGHVIESIDMLCDDPYSLCDRDLLGV